jgi:hypothetical protein
MTEKKINDANKQFPNTWLNTLSGLLTILFTTILSPKSSISHFLEHHVQEAYNLSFTM